MVRSGRLPSLVQLGSSIKAFVAKPAGRIVLLAFITLILAGAVFYTGYFLAIPIFILSGLGLPIYLGWKRARLLALVGLAALLVAGPIVSAAEVSLLRSPSPAAFSSAAAPYSGSVLQNATVHPFTGSPGDTYTFSVDVRPAYLPTNSSPLLWVDLFLSTCPGATGNSSPFCGGLGSYPFILGNHSYTGSAPSTVTFSEKLSGPNVWWWTIGAGYRDLANRSQLTWVWLIVMNGYTTVEGPVTGDFLSTMSLVVLPIYLAIFLYPGLVFFLGLLVYLFLKRRQRVRMGLPPAAPAAGKGGAPAPARKEAACPKCGAVVYEGEARCWKCGTALGESKDQPLASGGAPPS